MPDPALSHLLTRQSHRGRAAPGVAFLDPLALEPGRVHEACGAARRTLALLVAAAALRTRSGGQALWIRPAWMPERLNPDGVLRFLDPGSLLFATVTRAEDLLWCAEEALRSGAVPFVVADLPGPPGLTAVRRLHLAAEAGAAAAGAPPLGLLLTPGTGGAPGVESRWSLDPAHGDGGAEAWTLTRLRARTAPEARWTVRGEPAGTLALDTDTATAS